MGFWRDHGVIDFSIFFVRGRYSDVAHAGEEDLPVYFPVFNIDLKTQIQQQVDKSEHLFYTKTGTNVLPASR